MLIWNDEKVLNIYPLRFKIQQIIWERFLNEVQRMRNEDG